MLPGRAGPAGAPVPVGAPVGAPWRPVGAPVPVGARSVLRSVRRWVPGTVGARLVLPWAPGGCAGAGGRSTHRHVG
ncbi:hypothetical protein I552_7583 [Mycobacterium xenopi 3993]|nr:hypothetical protein I552_7583 [Mycobacterium xenopi 3993]